MTWNIEKAFRDPVTVGNTLVARIRGEEEKPFSVIHIFDTLRNTWTKMPSARGEFAFVSSFIQNGGPDTVSVEIEGDVIVSLGIGEVLGADLIGGGPLKGSHES